MTELTYSPRFRCVWSATAYLAVVLVVLVILATTLPVLAADNPVPAPKPAATVSSLFGDPLMVRGKGFEIHASQVEESFTAFRASAAAQGQQIPEFRRAEVERQVLDRLINVQVLLTKAIEADRVKAKDGADKAFADMRNRFPSEDAFKRKLISLGMPLDKFRQRLDEEALFKEVIDRTLKNTIVIPDEDVKNYYQTNLANFNEPERIRASHIMILTEDPITHQELSDTKKKEKKNLAEKILERLKAGEDFAKLAKEFSEDPNSNEKGGEIPRSFGRGTLMVPEFDAVAFTLQTGQISDLVPTKTGYHIIKVHEKIPARQLPFVEVSKDIKELLARQETQKQLPDYLKKLREEAGVEILRTTTF